MRPQDEWTDHWRNEVAQDMFNGMSVDGDDADRGRPFVVDFVDVLV